MVTRNDLLLLLSEIESEGVDTSIQIQKLYRTKDLPIDVIITMQAQVKEDPITSAVLKGPAIHGKLLTEFPAMFTTVIYTYCNPKGEFCATTLPKLGWPAKVRGTVGKDIVNPTFKTLFN